MAFLDKTGLERVWANTVALADTKVPTSRTVNGKPLSTDITLNASDVGADSSGSADKALDNAKSYTDSQIANKANKSTTLSGYGIADAYTKTDIDGKVSTLNTAINGKAASSHPHSIADVDGLQNELDGKLSTSGGEITGNFAVSSIISTRKKGAAITTAGWYRIFTSSIDDAGGDTVDFVLTHNWAYSETETYKFSVSVGYAGNIVITQLSGVSGIISKIRVVYKASDIYYIDFYYNFSQQNNVSVFGTGIGTFQPPTAVDSIPDGYSTCEFTTTHGCKTSSNFTGDLVGNATTASTATNASRLISDGSMPSIDINAGNGTIRYDHQIQQNSEGMFPTYNNANSIITLSKHNNYNNEDYDSQLGFSANGNIYYRNFNGAPTDTTTPWEKLAFSSEVDKKANGIKWTCPTERDFYSRLCQLNGYGSGLLTLTFDQLNQAVVYTYLICTSYNYVSINQIGYSNYPAYCNQKVRITAGSTAVQFNVELLNMYSATGSTVNVRCSYVTLSNGQELTPHMGETPLTSTNESYVVMCESKVDGMVISKIYGNLNGNATSATKATQDGDGNTITSTYAGRRVGGKNFTVDEQVITTGEGAEIFNDYTNNYAIGQFSHAEGSWVGALGDYSHAEGNYAMSIGDYSHTEGYNTIAHGEFSHTEGNNTITRGNCSHAEGDTTAANGYCSHAEGYNTIANISCSHAEGSGTLADGDCSHAEGYATTALDYQHAQGHYNNTATAKAGVPSGQGSTGSTAFVIGCGTSTSAANAFRVEYSGQIYALSAIKSTGRDYAEYFEWQDLNLDAEDRRGYFVTLDGDKIKIAEPNDYILGIVSGQPSVVGNGDEDWRGRYILDEFGAFITEKFEYEEEVWDKETNESRIVTKTGIKYKENPEYDPSLDYIQREDRPEWDAVGMMGVLSVRDDGTCEVNGYCKVAEGGIATASETGYRVIKRINDNIVEVIFR